LPGGLTRSESKGIIQMNALTAILTSSLLGLLFWAQVG